jgi:hypothetical protein
VLRSRRCYIGRAFRLTLGMLALLSVFSLTTLVRYCQAGTVIHSPSSTSTFIHYLTADFSTVTSLGPSLAVYKHITLLPRTLAP